MSRTTTRAEEVIAELTRRRADLAAHGRGSLERHLRGVHAMLGAWQQPEHVQLAGLLHSAYSTEFYGFRLFGRGERARVRELVGREAEHLVFGFCACHRDALLRTAKSSKRKVALPTRWRGTRLELERRELAELLVMHAANIVEQASESDGAPARSLTKASRFLAAAKDCGARVPRALFDRGRTSPFGEPLVLKGMSALARGRGDEARELGRRALEAFDVWATTLDKRLGLERWRGLAELLVRSGSKRDAELESTRRSVRLALAESESPADLWAALDARGELAKPEVVRAALPRKAVSGLPPRFAQYLEGLRTNHERPTLQFYPGLRVAPWHDPKQFPIVADLERLAPEIAREAKRFDVATWQDEAEEIERTGRWRVQFLLEMGRLREENLAQCPSLRWILDHHRTLTSYAGLMYFSCLEPGTRVAPHRGPTNVRLRCHLALEVPPDCGMRVGGVERPWEPGRCVVFDDSFEHEVWNDSRRRRVVLVLDLWHPDLTTDEIELLAGLHRFASANQAATKKYWARNEAAARRATPRRPDEDLESLSAKITDAMQAGDLEQASERALRYAQRCRGMRSPLPWQRTLTPDKLLHDIEQLEYLQQRGIMGAELDTVIERYESLLDTLRPLGERARVPLVGAAQAQVGHVYNRLIHVRTTPRVERALSDRWSPAAAEAELLERRPSLVVVDDFLDADALHELRLFCLESTVWSTNRYDHGRLGSFFRDGFNCPLLIQIAEELRDALPNVIGHRHPMTQLWGYKYATTQPALSPHADFAAVNVNFWITPDEANLDPSSGGLVVYDVDAPRSWDFPAYNRNASKIRELLAARNAKPTYIPYRSNRAVIFDSDLFHTTPALSFKPGYENRRINVTVLYGDRRDTARRSARSTEAAPRVVSLRRRG